MSIGRELRAGAGKRGIGTSGRSSGRLKGEKRKGLLGREKNEGATRQGTKAETKMKGRKRKTDSALSRVARESGHVAHHIAGEREPRTADIR